MKHRTRRLPLVLAAALFAGVALPPTPTAHACMPGASHPQQDAVIFWNDGVEVLVWRTVVEPGGGPVVPGARPRGGARNGNGRGNGASPRAPVAGPLNLVPARTGPARPTAWLLAVPSAPIAYDSVSAADFDGAINWVSSQLRRPPGGRGGPGGDGFGSGGGIGGLQIGATTRVGNYAVTPIQGTGPTAGAALATWLRTNHFPAANAAAVQAYLASGATFLAVRAMIPANTPRAELAPLAIAFRTPTIVLPVRLSAGEAPFQLNAAIFSGRVPALTATTTLSQGLRPVPVGLVGGPIGNGQSGTVSIIPYVSFPQVVRQLVNNLAPRVPQLQPLLSQPVAFSYISAAPITVDAAVADPTITLGAAVPANAPGSVR